MEFIKNDEHYKRYYDGMFILFKTGLRISEFCGLTLSDIDYEEKQKVQEITDKLEEGLKELFESEKYKTCLTMTCLCICYTMTVRKPR